MRRARKLFPGLLLALVLAVPFIPLAPRVMAQSAAPVASSSEQASTQPAEKNQQAEQSEDGTEAFRHSPAVKMIGHWFGLNIDQAATVFWVFNFVVLAVLVVGGLAKFMPKVFRGRTSAIQKNLQEARAATESANARLAGVEERLKNLDEQIAAMRAQAEKDAAGDEQRIKASIEEEKQKILDAAEQEITSATASARKQLQRYAADMAIEQAARKLVISAETDRLLVQEFARRVSGEKEEQN